MFKKSMRIIAMILVISLTAALVPTAVFADAEPSAAENEAVFDGEKNSATGVREGQITHEEFPTEALPEEITQPETEPINVSETEANNVERQSDHDVSIPATYSELDISKSTSGETDDASYVDEAPETQALTEASTSALTEEPTPTPEPTQGPPSGPTSGTDDNITWNISDDGTLTINGTGYMRNYGYSYSGISNAPWGASANKIKKAIISSGITNIGDYAFYNCGSLTSVTIPESVTSIGDRAFGYCSCLTSVMIPENAASIEGGTFFGCSSLTHVTIPESITSIGASVFYGCNSLKTAGPIGGRYNIEFGWTGSIPANAFNGCSSLTSVTIPESVTSIGYSAFYACSENLIFYVDPNSYAEQYAVDNNIEYEYILRQRSNITVKVADENGNAVSDGCTVEWRRKGSEDIISTGNTLTNADSGKAYSYKLRLDESLSLKYLQPATAEVIAGDQNTEITVKLTPQPKTKISGRAVNEAGGPLSGADVLISQIINGSIKNEVRTVTGENGEFSAEIIRANADITISLNGCYDALKNCVITSDTYNAGNIILQKLPDSKITLDMYMTASSESGSGSSSPIGTFDGLTISLYNKTQNKSLETLARQYPDITVDNGSVNAGDEIEITVTDDRGRMFSSPVTVTLNDSKSALGTIEFKQRGSLKAAVGGAGSALAFVFDSSGRLVKKYELTNTFNTDPLPDGEYKTAFIKKTDLLSSVPELSVLQSLGLSEGSDYVLKSASVSTGVITNLGGITVPDFDESKLYYTVSGETYYSSNKSTCPAGRLVTMTAKYKIDEKYSTSAQKLFFTIPENAEFVNNSMLVDGVQTPYTLENGGVSVITNSPQATVKFYTAAAAAGDYDLSAYLSFTEGGREVTQPIGSASFSVEDTAFTVTERTYNKTVPISGTVIPRSKVTIYKNEEPAGSVTANGNGSWSYDLDIDTTYNLSQTEVYAEIEAPYGTVLRTDTKKVLYDKDYTVLSKVTMYNTGDNGQNVTVFDFLNPSDAAPSYRMYPGRYIDFTFTIEFIGEADNVVLYVKTGGGNVYAYNAEYDESKGLWVVATQFTNFNDAPVNVAVDYTTKNEARISRDEINSLENDYKNITEEAEKEAETLNAMCDELDELYKSMCDETIGKEEFERRYALYEQKEEEFLKAVQEEDYAPDEEPEFDFSGMSNEEINAYLENEYEASVISENEIIEKIEQDTTVNVDPDENVSIENRTCDGLSAESLIADGFEKASVDDSTEIYIKAEGASLYYADFGSNLYQILTLPEKQAAELSAALEEIEELEEIAEAAAEMDPMAVVDQVSSRIKSVMSLIMDIRDSVVKKLEIKWVELKTEQESAAKELKRLKHDLKLLKDVGYYDDGAIAGSEYSEKVFNRRVKDLSRQIVRTKRMLRMLEPAWSVISKGFGKLVGVFDAFMDIFQVFKTTVDLYGKLPNECDCNRESLEEIRKEIRVLAAEMSVYAIADITAMVISGDAFMATVASGFLTAPATLPTAIVCLALRFGMGIVFENAVKAKSGQIEAMAEGAICPKVLCACHGGPGSCDCYENPEPTPQASNDRKIPTANIPPFCPQSNARPICDPSGYVCEAVPSNRLEGVTTTAYYLGDVLDDFGEPTGEKVSYEWDALDYDQNNPLITDANGEYAWDVPEGQWQVKYEKEGYETAYSEWMPVPPPQTEVHIAMVSKAAPEVLAVNAYKNFVMITFSKYMRIDTVNANSVKIKSGGAEIAGTIAPTDAEASFDDPNVMYARTFVFTPSAELSGSINVRISGAVSYCGTPISEYAADSAVKAEPEELSVGESVGIGCGSTAEIGFVILPKEAAAGAKVNVRSVTPSIVSATADTASAGADGSGKITVSGNLPGSGDIVLEIDGTSITRTIHVNVAAISAGKFAKKLVPIEVNGAGAGHAIIAAAYDGDIMIGSVTAAASGSGTDILNLECDASTKTAKIMEWESLESMRPVRPAEERRIN